MTPVGIYHATRCLQERGVGHGRGQHAVRLIRYGIFEIPSPPLHGVPAGEAEMADMVAYLQKEVLQKVLVGGKELWTSACCCHVSLLETPVKSQTHESHQPQVAQQTTNIFSFYSSSTQKRRMSHGENVRRPLFATIPCSMVELREACSTRSGILQAHR